MGSSKPRAAKVVYVAASARELPVEVQDWLTHAGNRATPSPNVYDALALLATGRKPAAMIVSMEAVDWSEMEFFDHAARLSADTCFYVTGPEHLTPKLQAACARGAETFDAESLNERLATPVDYRNAGPGGLLAGSLRPGGLRAAPLQPPPGPAIVVTEEEPVPASEPSERPVVRLVTVPEPEEQGPTEAAETPEASEPPVPFPWAPSANRPQRTPPVRLPEPEPEPVAEADVESLPAAQAPSPPPPAPTPRRTPPSVKITPDELAALLGRTPSSSGSGQEQRP